MGWVQLLQCPPEFSVFDWSHWHHWVTTCAPLNTRICLEMMDNTLNAKIGWTSTYKHLGCLSTNYKTTIICMCIYICIKYNIHKYTYQSLQIQHVGSYSFYQCSRFVTVARPSGVRFRSCQGHPGDSSRGSRGSNPWWNLRWGWRHDLAVDGGHGKL